VQVLILRLDYSGSIFSYSVKYRFTIVEKEIMNMIIVTPTFNFHGKCEDAINMYVKAFHAKIGCLLRYSDSDQRNWNMPLTEEQAKCVYHAEIFIGQQRIMLADILEPGIVEGTAVSLTITFDTAEEVMNAFSALQEDSTIVYPLHSTTYSSCIGVLVDRFGIRWGLMTEQTER